MLYLLLHQRMDLRFNGYNVVAEDCCCAAENSRTRSANSADYLPDDDCKHIRRRGMERMPCSWASWVVYTNCPRKCPLLATAPALSLEQEGPIEFLRVHASQLLGPTSK